MCNGGPDKLFGPDLVEIVQNLSGVVRDVSQLVPLRRLECLGVITESPSQTS